MVKPRQYTAAIKPRTNEHTHPHPHTPARERSNRFCSQSGFTVPWDEGQASFPSLTQDGHLSPKYFNMTCPEGSNYSRVNTADRAQFQLATSRAQLQLSPAQTCVPSGLTVPCKSRMILWSWPSAPVEAMAAGCRPPVLAEHLRLSACVLSPGSWVWSAEVRLHGGTCSRKRPSQT